MFSIGKLSDNTVWHLIVGGTDRFFVQLQIEYSIKLIIYVKKKVNNYRSSTYFCRWVRKRDYDMDKLSKEAHLSPTFAVSAVRGDISLSDLLEPNDTVIFDEDDFVRIIIRKDSVVDIHTDDFFDQEEMISFSETFEVGDMKIAPFSGQFNLTLDQITLKFSSPSLRATFVSLDDGSLHNFRHSQMLISGNIHLPLLQFCKCNL